MKNSKKIFIISSIIVVLMSIVVGSVAYAASLMPKTSKATQSPVNPDDAVNYIVASDNDIGGKEYSFTISSVNPVIPKGTMRSYDGYTYVYGYYYSGSGAVNDLSNWVAISESASDYGWGCAATSRTASSYSDPKGVLGYYTDGTGYSSSGSKENMANESITGEPVTYFTNAFKGCSNMTDIPVIPTVAKNTDYIFQNCTGLTKVVLSGFNSIGKNAFKGCTNLTKVFITSQTSTIPYGGSTGPFVDVNSSCKLYCERASKPSGWANDWYSGVINTSANIKWNADYLIIMATEF